MGFKLDQIKIEGASARQKVTGQYDFYKKMSLNEDRTFCLFNCDSNAPCVCNMDPYGDMPSPGCYDHDDE